MNEKSIDEMLEYIENHCNDIQGVIGARKQKKKPRKVILSGLDIKQLPSCSTNFEQRPFMKQGVIPDMPSSIVFVGSTGSGKSTALLNMFLNKDMYRGYFDEIYLFSPTGYSDSLFEHLDLSEDHVITTNMVEELEKLVKKLKHRADNNNMEDIPKVAIIFEDLSSNKKLMSDFNKPFIECFVQNRHMGVMTFSAIHKWKSLTRTCRLQCSSIIFYPSNVDDVKMLAADTAPPDLSIKQYINLINFAHQPDKTNSKPFLYINRKLPFEKRYRKTFKYLLNINEFK